MYCNAPGLGIFLVSCCWKILCAWQKSRIYDLPLSSTEANRKAVILSALLQGYLLKCASDLKFLFVFQKYFDAALPKIPQKTKKTHQKNQ